MGLDKTATSDQTNQYFSLRISYPKYYILKNITRSALLNLTPYGGRMRENKKQRDDEQTKFSSHVDGLRRVDVLSAYFVVAVPWCMFYGEMLTSL